jgi:hypothetical protein
MERIAAAVATGEVVNTIDRVCDQFTGFVALEPTMFSLAERDVFPILHDPAVKDTAIMECLDRVVSGLFSVCATLGALPIIRCERVRAHVLPAAPVPDMRGPCACHSSNRSCHHHHRRLLCLCRTVLRRWWPRSWMPSYVTICRAATRYLLMRCPVAARWAAAVTAAPCW